MSSQYDVIVIGAGPAGYVCAIRAAQLGMKVACVERRSTLGGTCLNVGCIPSKALLQSSEKYFSFRNEAAKHGIVAGEISFNLANMMARKDEIVSANIKGIQFLFKKHNISWIKGAAVFKVPGTIVVAGTDYSAKHFVIATGSESLSLPGLEIDETRIVTSTGALTLKAVPRRLVVIGGGYIGLELGTMWGRLGSEVTVVEFLDRLIPTMDAEIAESAKKILEKAGLKFKLGRRVVGATRTNASISLTLTPANGDGHETLEADVVLVAIGRRAHTSGLGLAGIGVALDGQGRVKTDKRFATNVPGIYAIGDVIAGPMLAHKAAEEGIALAEILAGQAGNVNYSAIPGVIYTWPEVASVGKTEEELRGAGVSYKVGKFPFIANGRARTMGDTDGFVKIIADKRTDTLLGAHIIGPDASAIIGELVVAMEFGASAEDIARTSHAHPSLNEAVKEAALAVDGRALHI